MKFKNFILISFFLFLCTSISLYGNENYQKNLNGVELCDEIFYFLKDEGFNPVSQNLLLKGDNNFPYNIFVKISNKKFNKETIIFNFLQEDVIKNKNTIKEFIQYVKDSNFSFNTIILFSYGDKQKIKKTGMIQGANSFIQNLVVNDETTGIIIDLSSNETSVKSSSQGIVAPSWLTQNEFNIFLKYKLDENIPYTFLSQIYTYNFFHDELLSTYFNHQIPAIRLNFTKDLYTDNLILDILKDSIKYYSETENHFWDQHFLMFRAYNHFIRLTEVGTIKIIIVIMFLWILFILLFIFVNSRMKKQAWATIKHIWYSVPGTFVLIILGFYIGKKIGILFTNEISAISNVFILASWQLIISLIFVSFFYGIILLLNSSFVEKSIDYLIVISCFINQAFFIFIDVSLFPIFMFVCILAILTLVVKNNGIHIAIFFLMLLPFFPYLSSLINFADFDILFQFLVNDKMVPVVMSLITIPTFLIYLRVLTAIKRNTQINIFLIMGIILVSLSLIIILLGIILNAYIKNKTTSESEIKIEEVQGDFMTFEYSDKFIFDDLIRTININFLEQPEQCSVEITAFSTSPILYTENDYDYVSKTSTSFKIPYYPPKELTFTYGSTQEPALITITGIFKGENELEYKSYKKVVPIGR